MLRSSIIILITLLVVSCGKTTDEKTMEAVLSANISLSKGNCQEAINILEANGRQNNNSHYLKTLASAYACRSKFSVVTFFASDIGLSVTPAPLGGAAKYSTSLAVVSTPLQTDNNFQDLQTAINILYYAGGFSSATEPTSFERLKYFTTTDAGEINSQLLFMTLAQLGKYMKVYANAGTTGVKGSGGAGNNCFTNYTDAGIPPPIITALSSMPGACKVTNSPHAQLATAVTARRTRLCQGVVLVNGILDTLPSVIASGAGSLGSISTLTANINSYKASLVAAYPAVGLVTTVLSQYNCENDPGITTATLESYFAIIFEALIQ
ncbi:MAG: hypothetical protein H7281_03375 [Bacteriovorax sp.]|nr:hypothetical protein [Bacteriovorax sp.]